MRKKEFIVTILAIFLFSFIPLVFSQECGDFVCDVGEEATCPSDCTGENIVNPEEIAYDEEEIAPAPDEITYEEEMTYEDEEVTLETSNDGEILNDNNDNFSNIGINILIVVSVLILIGAIGFIIYLKVKKKSSSSPASPVSVKPQAPAVVSAQSKAPVPVNTKVAVKKQPVEKEVGYDVVTK